MPGQPHKQHPTLTPFASLGFPKGWVVIVQYQKVIVFGGRVIEFHIKSLKLFKKEDETSVLCLVHNVVGRFSPSNVLNCYNEHSFSSLVLALRVQGDCYVVFI